MKLLSSLVDPSPIIRVDDEDESLCAREVMPPQRPYLVLSSHIPNVELDILVCDGLDVEADRGDGGDV